MADLTIGESRYLEQLRTRLARLRSYLDEALLPADATPERWYRYVAEIRAIQGNVSNDLSFIATLLAKQYLSTRFAIVDFDASTKAQGAPGLDIDVRTAGGARVIGEIKTTVPYAGARGDLGAAQKTTFQKDFDKLNREVAEHKFFFVTNETTYRLVRAKYATYIPGVDIVLLVAEDFTSHSRSATAPIGLE